MEVLDCWYKNVCKITPCDEHCLRYREMNYLVEQSGLQKSQTYNLALSCDDDSVDYEAFVKLADIKRNIKSFVDNGNNLYISSEFTGNGKTTWAIKMLMSYFNNIQERNAFRPRGLFLQVPITLLRFKNFDESNRHNISVLREKLISSDLVVWDDLGSMGLSQYDLTNLFAYIDARVSARKSNIFTTNLTTFDRLEKSVGTRLASRIFDTSVRIELKGRSKRDGSVTTLK